MYHVEFTLQFEIGHGLYRRQTKYPSQDELERCIWLLGRGFWMQASMLTRERPEMHEHEEEARETILLTRTERLGTLKLPTARSGPPVISPFQ